LENQFWREKKTIWGKNSLTAKDLNGKLPQWKLTTFMEDDIKSLNST
jgi:hypothetical protein